MSKELNLSQKEKIVSFRALDGSEKEIDNKNDLEDYLDQICSVFDFLGQATQAKIRDAAESNFPYTLEVDDDGYIGPYDDLVEVLFGDLSHPVASCARRA